MRIGLVNEGTYPVVKGGVSTWCDQLIRRLDEHEWHVVTMVGEERAPVGSAPAPLASTTLVPLWDPVRRRPAGAAARRRRRDVAEALDLLWRSVLPPSGDATLPELTGLRAALQVLAERGRVTLAQILEDRGSFRPLLAAWAEHRAANPDLPPLTVAQAARAAQSADRTLGVLDARWPQVDLVNASANGTAALAAMARQWADGTPFVLTEHGVYLRERYLALDAAGWDWTVRYVSMAFTRALCHLAYREATYIAPVNRFNSRWECRLGADPARIVPIPNGVDPESFPAVPGEPDEPVVSFVGRIDPLKDLRTMIEALAIVRAEIPNARLRLFGPTPAANTGYRASLEALVADLHLGEAVTFEGPSPSARPAIEAGQVVALSSISEGLPFTVIEAMMSGRPTVNTDVGGVAEVTGPDGLAALVVPPRDPAAFALALVTLRRDAPRRAAMGAAARQRMLADFSEPVFVERYRHLYDAVAARRPVDFAELGIEPLAAAAADVRFRTIVGGLPRLPDLADALDLDAVDAAAGVAAPATCAAPAAVAAPVVTEPSDAPPTEAADTRPLHRRGGA